MARRDGTGPTGMGPMTGRGLGVCAPASNRPMYGGGYGGGGRACRRGFRANPAYDQASSKEMLESQKDQLENALKNIDQQLEDL